VARIAAPKGTRPRRRQGRRRVKKIAASKDYTEFMRAAASADLPRADDFAKFMAKAGCRPRAT